MTIKPRIQSVPGQISDLYKRVKRLEANPCDCDGGSDAGGCTCQCVEGDANRALPIDRGNYIGEVGYGFTDRINTFVQDANCEGNGYFKSTSPAEFDATYWTPWLGPTGARFRLNIVTLMGTSGGQLHLYAQRMVESATEGIWEPEEDPIDVFADFAGDFADLYAGSTQYNVWNVTPDFGIEGECDDVFSASSADAPYGYAINGGPSFYRLWVVVEGKNGASGGYQCFIQNAWLKRIFQEEA